MDISIETPTQNGRENVADPCSSNRSLRTAQIRIPRTCARELISWEDLTILMTFENRSGTLLCSSSSVCVENYLWGPHVYHPDSQPLKKFEHTHHETSSSTRNPMSSCRNMFCATSRWSSFVRSSFVYISCNWTLEELSYHDYHEEADLTSWYSGQDSLPYGSIYRCISCLLNETSFTTEPMALPVPVATGCFISKLEIDGQSSKVASHQGQFCLLQRPVEGVVHTACTFWRRCTS